MIIGTLLEVMCLNEDWMTVRQNIGSRAKAQGRPLGMTAGSTGEVLSKAKANLSPKDYKKFEDSIINQPSASSQANAALNQMRQGIKDKRAGLNTPEAQRNWEMAKYLKQYSNSIGIKRTDPEFKNRLIKDLINSTSNKLPSHIGAMAIQGQDIIAANTRFNGANPIINSKTGRIDPNSSTAKHEIQHIAQSRANDAVDKYYGLEPGTTQKAYVSQYADLSKMHDDKEKLKYGTDPYEFDSNATALSNAKPGVRGSTVRIAKQMIGKTPNPVNPTLGRGAEINSKVLGDNGVNGLDAIKRRKLIDQQAKEKLGQYRHTDNNQQKVTAEMRRKEKLENEKIAATAKQVGALYDMDGTLRGKKVKSTINRNSIDPNNPTIIQIRKAQEKLRKQQEAQRNNQVLQSNPNQLMQPDTNNTPRLQQRPTQSYQLRNRYAQDTRFGAKPQVQQSTNNQYQISRPQQIAQSKDPQTYSRAKVIGSLNQYSPKQRNTNNQLQARQSFIQNKFSNKISKLPGSVADRNTGIVYAKKNGKLVSNVMNNA